MATDKYTHKDILTYDEIKKMIKDNNVKMIRIEYTDMLGIQRGKLLPAEMVDDLEEGVAFCSASFGMNYDNEIIHTDYLKETSDDIIWKPDLSTFKILPFDRSTALIVGDLYYDGTPFKTSPRDFLKQIVDEYHELGYEPMAASELEFYVYEKGENGELIPYTNQPSNCYTANRRIDPKGFLTKLTATYNAMDYNVLFMNHEYFSGQYEYNWKYATAVRAADESAVFKELTKDIAEMDDMAVSFMAKPKGAEGGSGCHFHVSLMDVKTGENVCDDKNGEDGISDLLRYMIGGILKHGKGLSAFLAPTINCYKRYQPDSFAPIYLGWGMDNRTTYIRIPKERGKGSRLEVRAGSAACNPYLAIAGILAAALDGIKHKIEPPKKIVTDLYHDEAKQQESGRVPTSLFRAIDALQNDEWLAEEMAPELCDLFCKMKQHEITTYKSFITDWEMDTYAYHV